MTETPKTPDRHLREHLTEMDEAHAEPKTDRRQIQRRQTDRRNPPRGGRRATDPKE